jgi:hypothetical protein
MYPPFKRTLAPTDRLVFEKCLKGAAVFCASVTLLAVCAFVVGHISGGSRGDVAILSKSPPASPALRH